LDYLCEEITYADRPTQLIAVLFTDFALTTRSLLHR
jgi:hypothetical protein